MSKKARIVAQCVGHEFVFKTIEIYKPGPGELLVKIKATGLNPSIGRFRRYDIAGDVVELGEGVEGFTKGDKVFFQGEFNNRNIPEGWSYDQVATIPLTLITAWRGMYNKLGFDLTSPTSLNDSPKGKYANMPILISEAQVQLVKWFSGFAPIITTSSLKHESYLKSLGATHLIDRYLPLPSLPSEAVQAGYDLLANGGNICTVYPGLKVKETEGSGKKPNRLEVLPSGLHGAFEGLKRLEDDQVSAGKLIIHPDETD
ncbi:hypothetical protein BDQ17DRAFT_1392881 [Cyathus striatus]|nr:hypothetical protein BDQ17DRAFT_1392881 [Cyathus striatus]